MRFAFFLHPERSEAATLADRAGAWLGQRGHRVETVTAEAGGAASVEGADLVVSFGGDGTMLKAVEAATTGGVPVLGVNVGRLGYLTEVEPDDLERALAAVLEGTLQIEERMTLAVSVTTPSGETGPDRVALNEASVEKTVPGHTVRLEASVDDRPFVTFAADGVLVATPTGSTAYNLSARGPILSPRLRAIVVTPVSPHMLFDRPLVLEPTECLRLTVGLPRAAVLVVDGVSVATLEPGASVTCREGDRPARLVVFEGRDFHAILRAKFHLADQVGAVVLWELRVRDVGVIDDITVELGPGLTALTGETGAGKTLIVEALGLLLGGRADPAVVRAGAAEALVEGRFAAPDGTGEVVLARAVSAAGRSRAWIDGRMATLAALEAAGAEVVELHGQHRHRALVHPAAQRAALDDFAGVDPAPLAAARRAVRALAAESDALGGDGPRRARQADLLRYQIDEIGAAGLGDEDEDAGLEAEEDRLAQAGALREAAGAAHDVLAGGEDSALDRLSAAAALLAGRPALSAMDARVRSLMAEAGDVAADLRHAAETWEEDPARLEAVRARRQLLRELGRKYGPTPGEITAFAAAARDELSGLEAAEARARTVDAELDGAREAGAVVEAAVAEARRAAAPRLAATIESTLATLAMGGARMEIDVSGDGPADDVVFLLAANRGEPPLPLAKVASGGELSRTMLALRLALAGGAGTLVFDEVDAGIGGEAAVAVGVALAELGRRTQVLVVTHLAQVAARAAHHLAVTKGVEAGRTRSVVTPLDDDGRVVELSRMLSGAPGSATARRHARELLAAGRSAGGRARVR